MGMWNKFKWFLGGLIITGCVMLWFSWFSFLDLGIPICSSYLKQYGFLFIKWGLILFFVVLVLHGINEHLFRFKSEELRKVWQSKKVTRAVATISIVALILTGIGWLVIRPYLMELGSIPVEEVAKNPVEYVGKKISITGYYLPDVFRMFYPIGIDCDGYIFSVPVICKTPEEMLDFYQALGKQRFLLVKLPPMARINTGKKYMFTGILENATAEFYGDYFIFLSSSIEKISVF